MSPRHLSLQKSLSPGILTIAPLTGKETGPAPGRACPSHTAHSWQSGDSPLCAGFPTNSRVTSGLAPCSLPSASQLRLASAVEEAGHSSWKQGISLVSSHGLSPTRHPRAGHLSARPYPSSCPWVLEKMLLPVPGELFST